mmetsp:Transcript_89565/g.187112  ORF Transcript_89565/g.187112 Transcript_89565/m.187112 type:complete len:229 (-) Transcript_89565:31-717(-)
MLSPLHYCSRAVVLLGFAATLPNQADCRPSILEHTIINAKADIRDLDVGDLEDMHSDVTPDFLVNLDLYENPRPPLDVTKAVQDPAAIVAQSQNGITMVFATLLMKTAEELLKPGTERLGTVWKTKLEAGGVTANVFGVDPGRILITTQKPEDFTGVRKFVLEQPELDWLEVNSQKIFPPGRNAPITSVEERKKRERELGWLPAQEEKKSKPSPKKRRQKGKGKAGEL